MTSSAGGDGPQPLFTKKGQGQEQIPAGSGAAEGVATEVVDHTGPGVLEAVRPLSLQSGRVNGLRAPQLREALAIRGMDNTGSKQVLSRRLKQYLRRIARATEAAEALPEAASSFEVDSEGVAGGGMALCGGDSANGSRDSKALKEPPRTPFDYLCVVDFEATCERAAKDFPHEIIEFPIVLVDCITFERVRQRLRYDAQCRMPCGSFYRDIYIAHLTSQVAEFQSYCRPTVNPILSAFCTELTGIAQVQPPFIRNNALALSLLLSRSCCLALLLSCSLCAPPPPKEKDFSSLLPFPPYSFSSFPVSGFVYV